MARKVRRRNPPRLFGPGEDLEKLLLVGGGVGATQFVNEHVVGKFLGGLIPKTDGAMAKAVDAATTLLSAMAIRYGVGLVNKDWGRYLSFGGDALAVAKGVGAIVPIYTLSGNVSLPSGFGLKQVAEKKAAELPASNGNGVGQTLQQIGVKQMGL